MKNTEGLKFESLEVENFKNIDKRIVNINGRSLLITGENGAGKSSLIQALLSGIDPKIQPTNSIKTGEKLAKTTVKLKGVLNGEQEEYLLEMFYTPANQSGRIVLKNKLGETVKSPKEVLKSIIGNISFDIFTFLKSKKADQIKVLKELSGVAPEINKLDFERKAKYEERTFINRVVSESEAIMNNHEFTPEEVHTYSIPIPIEPLQEEMDGISKKIANWNEVKGKVEEFSKDIYRIPVFILSKQKKIDELQEQIESLKGEIITERANEVELKLKVIKGKEWLDNNPEPKAADVSRKISDAMLHNEKFHKVTDLAEKQKTLLENKHKSERFTMEIESIDKKKDDLIKNSKLPVKGLTFSEDSIFLDGIPLEENQVNQAKLIEIGIEIAMALNPILKYIFIHEGSLIDVKNRNELFRKIHDRGYEFICEIVSDDSEVGVEFIEMEA